MSSSDRTDPLYSIQLPTESTQDVQTSTLNFRQRQSDVFAALANLEAAHNEVNKATKEERKLIRKTAWKQTLTAPENLVEQKECRDKILKRQSSPQEVTSFRRPPVPPNRRPVTHQPRDPNKWTYYSLADVDEDGPSYRSDSNASIAMAFINELRERNSEQSDQSERDHDPQNRRILFRPTRGTKKPRLDEEAIASDATCTNSVPVSCNLNGDDEVDDGSDELPSQRGEPLESNNPQEVKPKFNHRQRRFRQRDRSVEDDPTMSLSETSSSVIEEVDEMSEAETLLNNLDEMEHDVGEDHSEDHLF